MFQAKPDRDIEQLLYYYEQTNIQFQKALLASARAAYLATRAIRQKRPPSS